MTELLIIGSIYLALFIVISLILRIFVLRYFKINERLEVLNKIEQHLEKLTANNKEETTSRDTNKK